MENTHELYESPQREANFEKYGHLMHQCICCGKPMKETESLMVHMNTKWVAVRNDIDETNCLELTGYESQGCFDIGNSCAKKMPSKFIIKPSNKHDKKSEKNIKTLDDIRNLSLRIVDRLVKDGVISNCTNTDEDTEFWVQDIITDLLCERFNIQND